MMSLPFDIKSFALADILVQYVLTKSHMDSEVCFGVRRLGTGA